MKTSKTEMTLEEQIIEQIRTSMARYYREQLSKSVKNGLMRKNGLKAQLKTNNKQK